ncbi:MAG TPA: phage major capsid protein [Rudaea sp.]
MKQAIAHAEVIDRVSTRQRGFRDFGDFLTTVRNSSKRETQGRPDPRLVFNLGPGAPGNENVGTDGGFAVPPSFVGEVVRKILQTNSLLLATDARTTQSNSLSIPKDETTPWQTSGGIQVYWDGEDAQEAQSKPELTAATVKTCKLIALVPITDELADDSNALVEHVSAKTPEKIAFAVESAIIAGIGGTRPKGILASAGTIIVSEESGQTAATIVPQNVVKMWNRVLPSARRNGTWLCHPDADLQLQQMVFSDSAGDVTASAPLYQPPTAIFPNGSILGRPIYFSEGCSVVGSVGDIVFGDLSAYLSVTKMLRSDVSIHLWFDYNVTAYRFVLRIGGQPWTDSLVPSLNGGVSRGFFATLAARS